MSRGLLSDEELRQIEQQLPDTTQVATLVHEYDPDSVPMQVSSMNRLPNAAVCLHDALVESGKRRGNQECPLGIKWLHLSDLR